MASKIEQIFWTETGGLLLRGLTSSQLKPLQCQLKVADPCRKISPEDDYSAPKSPPMRRSGQCDSVAKGAAQAPPTSFWLLIKTALSLLTLRYTQGRQFRVRLIKIWLSV